MFSVDPILEPAGLFLVQTNLDTSLERASVKEAIEKKMATPTEPQRCLVESVETTSDDF